MTPNELRQADAALLQAAADIRVLRAFRWPTGLCERFLSDWRRGEPRLPEPPPVSYQAGDNLRQLERLAGLQTEHPAGRFIARTAQSYLTAGRMLEHAGTPEFTRLSTELYGKPDQPISPGGLTNFEAAQRFARSTEGMARHAEEEPSTWWSTEKLATKLKEKIDRFFVDDTVVVEIDSDLAAKACAGAEAIRLRADSRFHPNDLLQLYHHEATVHTATVLNGRRQPHLRSLALGAPRTTATQEGLATFSELITRSIDLARLRRVALRVEAIALGLQGADFIEVFHYFLDAAQTPEESYHSTARIFRGGDVRGNGVVFTKDGVYLRGLFEVHAFFNAAFDTRRLDALDHLFAGRLTCGDVVEMEGLFESGFLVAPRYLPEWARHRDRFAGYLAFASLTHSQAMGSSSWQDFAPA